jgi:hypothetical protein
MRHGRKSKGKRFNGFKEYVLTELDSELIDAAIVLPANRPEEEATPALQQDLDKMNIEPDELHLDRAFINSKLAEQAIEAGREVVCKPWKGANRTPELYGKKDFTINIRNGTIECPAGQVESFEPGQVVEFDPEACGACPLRAKCTQAATGRGRTVTMGDNEPLQKRLRKLQGTRSGRARLRERTGVEHRLAQLARRQGRRARYLGTRKNTFDLRRHCAIQNLETISRRIELHRQQA